MKKHQTPEQIVDSINKKFTILPSLFCPTNTGSLILEVKPYLQPFERLLALRELQSLLRSTDRITEEHDYYTVQTNKAESVFCQRLTYWQRVGRKLLVPTIQTCLEFTQNGQSQVNDRQELHNARRLRYGPHNLHEYRGKFFPQLVRSLINISGVRDEAIVLDPMCGSGTTLCEALALNRSAIGLDLNPLSVLVSKVKAGVVLKQPRLFYKTISSYLSNFHFNKTSPDKIWSPNDLSYLIRWFSTEAINDLSAILTDINKVHEQFYRDFFRVCLSNIIRSVSWQKDTDLRVRKDIKHYDKGMAISLFKEITLKQLDRIYPYLSVLPHNTNPPSVSIRQGNVINMLDIFPGYHDKIDLLITSPPYATALPYLDTDRLSLVALGLLPRKQHKDIETIMIGTREVSECQRKELWERYCARRKELPDAVTKLIDKIAEYNHSDHVGFRRRNLPALLGKYYLDMLDAMRSAYSLMKSGAYGYFVVGNNSTILEGQKIEIPTDKYLFEIGAAAMWKQQEIIPMELLVSRDIFKENRGSSESILCFVAEKKIKRKAIYTSENVDILTKDGIEWNYHDADTQEHLHALHPYPAKFIPQIPRKAIESWSSKGEVIYDPFCGCGTTLLEASLMGRPSIGTDNNPVAILVSKAKTASYKLTDVDSLRIFANKLDEVLPITAPRKELIPDNSNFYYWFTDEVLDRLSSLKSLILNTKEPIQTILLSIFSSIIVRVSFQDSDTRYAKIKRTVKPSAVGRIFKLKLLEIIERLPGVIIPGRSPVKVYQADARDVSFIKDGSVALIITSPPYLNAYDYHKYHRQRIHWINGSVEFARDMELGSHDEFTKRNATPDQYFIDIDACFSEWSRVLRNSGKSLIVIGDAIVNKKPVCVADTFIELCKKHRMCLVKRWIRALHSTKRAFNVQNSRITHEHVLLFEKK